MTTMTSSDIQNGVPIALTVSLLIRNLNYAGNNCAVIVCSTGAVEQTIAYYPYGGIIADLGTDTSDQPFKFGGKELTLHNGLNEYDFGARQYYPAIPHFTSVDPLCEKYYWLSPYLYCGNNPVNFFDSNGMEFTEESYKFVNMLLKLFKLISLC